MHFIFTKEVLNKLQTINNQTSLSVAFYKNKENQQLLLLANDKSDIESNTDLRKILKMFNKLSEPEINHLIRENKIFNLRSFYPHYEFEVNSSDIMSYIDIKEFTQIHTSIGADFIFLILSTCWDNKLFKNKSEENRVKKERELASYYFFTKRYARCALNMLGEELFRDFLNNLIKHSGKGQLTIKNMQVYCQIITMVPGNIELIKLLIEENMAVFEKKNIRSHFTSTLYLYDKEMGEFAESHLNHLFGADTNADLLTQQSMQMIELSILKVVKNYPMKFEQNPGTGVYSALAHSIVKEFATRLGQLYPHITRSDTNIIKSNPVLLINATPEQAQKIKEQLSSFLHIGLQYYQKIGDNSECLNYKDPGYAKDITILFDKFIEKEKLRIALETPGVASREKKRFKI